MMIQMTDEFYPLLQAHSNRTELDIDEELAIYGDAAQLARVFNNILKNAIAYSYPNTVIRIWAEKMISISKYTFKIKEKQYRPINYK